MISVPFVTWLQTKMNIQKRITISEDVHSFFEEEVIIEETSYAFDDEF